MAWLAYTDARICDRAASFLSSPAALLQSEFRRASG